MKKMIIGVGIFICGVIVFCMDYAIQTIIGAMPDTTLLPGGIPLSWASYGILLIGAVLIWLGYTQD